MIWSMARAEVDSNAILASAGKRSVATPLLRRRDKVAAHIEALIAERGEGAVLFDNPR